MSLPDVFFQLLDESGKPIDIEGFNNIACFESYEGAMDSLNYLWGEGLYEGNAIIRRHSITRKVNNGGYKNAEEIKAKHVLPKGSYGGFCSTIKTKSFCSPIENDKLLRKKLEMEYKWDMMK